MRGILSLSLLSGFDTVVSVVRADSKPATRLPRTPPAVLQNDSDRLRRPCAAVSARSLVADSVQVDKSPLPLRGIVRAIDRTIEAFLARDPARRCDAFVHIRAGLALAVGSVRFRADRPPELHGVVLSRGPTISRAPRA